MRLSDKNLKVIREALLFSYKTISRRLEGQIDTNLSFYNMVAHSPELDKEALQDLEQVFSIVDNEVIVRDEKTR